MSLAGENQSLIAMWESPVRLRHDLQVVTIRRGLQVTHVIKDPVNLKYFEFDDHEMALIQQLDGQKGWDDICQWFNHRFPPLRLSHHSLHLMIWRLYQQGLLLSDAAGQGRRVAERSNQLKRQVWVQNLSHPWVVRLPGVNPGPWMGLVNAAFGWVFSPVFVGLASVMLVLLAAFAFAQHEAILRTAPGTAEFFSRNNLLLFAAVIVITKICHELGHAVAAYRQGCECHEMGILLLAGLPSLYCDVSDAWILTRRWQRIAVSLAGIWIEILIAATAFIVWTTSVPGVVHAVSFNVMIVCSVGTLLFNANPLVRYDGYYVLMDLSGISNLGQRSHEAVVSVVTRWVFGSPDLRPLDTPEVPRWCLVYGAAAAIYRVLLTFAILWGLHLVLKPFSLSILVWILASVALVIWSTRFLRANAIEVQRTIATGTPRWRIGLGLAVTVGSLAACAFIPLPWYVLGDAVMQPADQQSVVATVPGRLLERKDSGSQLEVGDLVARLQNHDIEREIQQLESERQVQNQHLQALLARRNQDVRAAAQIPAATAMKADLDHRLSHLLEERLRLELRAGETAMIYPAPVRFKETETEELANWTGSLLDPINRNAWIEVGDMFCQIGSIDRLEAIAILAQDDMEAVVVGQRVDILLRSSGRIVDGEIAKISSLKLDSLDETTISAMLPRMADSRGGGQLHGKWYQVQIRCLSPVPQGTFVRSHSKVRIHVGSRTVGEWIAQQFFKTFRWHA